MNDYIMKVIHKPKEKTASVLVLTKKKSAIKGDGEDNYICGKCKFVICENIKHGQILDAIFVFKCPNCESYSTIKSC